MVFYLFFFYYFPLFTSVCESSCSLQVTMLDGACRCRLPRGSCRRCSPRRRARSLRRRRCCHSTAAVADRRVRDIEVCARLLAESCKTSLFSTRRARRVHAIGTPRRGGRRRRLRRARTAVGVRRRGDRRSRCTAGTRPTITIVPAAPRRRARPSPAPVRPALTTGTTRASSRSSSTSLKCSTRWSPRLDGSRAAAGPGEVLAQRLELTLVVRADALPVEPVRAPRASVRT